MAAVEAQDAAPLRKQGLRLEYLTIGWNVVEAVVAVASGLAAGSLALVAFGFDSTIEVLAASVVVWQFRSGLSEEREARALRLIAVTFFVLAAYVSFEAVRDLFFVDEEAGTSAVGIVLAVLSLIVMPSLALAKRRVGQRLGSRTLIADSTETFLCSWLSAALLVGLVANAAFGWWWADPVAGVAIGALALREGVEAWRGEGCDQEAG